MEIRTGASEVSEDKDGRVKVTDKRMFTPTGELREEYRFLEGEGKAAEAVPRETPPPAPPTAEPPQPEAVSPDRPTSPEPGEPEAAPPPLEIPGTPPGLGAPSFYDLISVLAEPIALYLGDVELPDGRRVEDLEMARLHIDLLDLLRQKTAGRLTAQESTALEETLYQLRLRYVQKRG